MYLLHRFNVYVCTGIDHSVDKGTNNCSIKTASSFHSRPYEIRQTEELLVNFHALFIERFQSCNMEIEFKKPV